MKTSYLIERLEGRVTLDRIQVNNHSHSVTPVPVADSAQVGKFDAKFEMGYSGAGPQQLACAILLDAFTILGSPHASRVAVTKSFEFMMEHLTAAKIPIDRRQELLTLDEVLGWYIDQTCAKLN